MYAKTKTTTGTAVSIVTKTKRRFFRLPFTDVKNAILGKRYELSLVLVTPLHIAQLNKTYRGKNKPTDILSFPLTASLGEIIIAPSIIEKKAALHGMTPRDYALRLFIHGCLHLEGREHGATMDTLERRFLNRFRKHSS